MRLGIAIGALSGLARRILQLLEQALHREQRCVVRHRHRNGRGCFHADDRRAVILPGLDSPFVWPHRTRRMVAARPRDRLHRCCRCALFARRAAQAQCVLDRARGEPGADFTRSSRDRAARRAARTGGEVLPWCRDHFGSCVHPSLDAAQVARSRGAGRRPGRAARLGRRASRCRELLPTGKCPPSTRPRFAGEGMQLRVATAGRPVAIRTAQLDLLTIFEREEILAVRADAAAGRD